MAGRFATRLNALQHFDASIRHINAQHRNTSVTLRRLIDRIRHGQIWMPNQERRIVNGAHPAHLNLPAIIERAQIGADGRTAAGVCADQKLRADRH